MFKNYLLLALRQLRKNRGYSFINIFGLATGMAIALVIGIWAIDELSVDKHIRTTTASWRSCKTNGQKERPRARPHMWDYRLVCAQSLSAERLQGCLRPNGDVYLAQRWLLVNGDKSISRQGSSAEYTFPLIFGYHFLSGTAESLRDPNTALISRSTAIALFGTENAVGKTFKYKNRRPFTVGGVYADQPANSIL